jgi:micrococcal nuclease
MMIRPGRCLLLVRILCLFGFNLIAAVPFLFAWEGKVTGVTDGTYITVLHDGKGERVSLYGVDCPGIRQDFGPKAKEFTSERVLRKVVEIEPVVIDRKGKTKDQYGRTLALVYADGRKCLNEELIRSGFAWVYNQTCTKPECKGWKELERHAKRQKLGLWSALNPIPPWEFRHSKGVLIPVYQGDIVKHVFHSSNCEEFDCNSCIAVFKGREQAIRAGYKPCDKCNP